MVTPGKFLYLKLCTNVFSLIGLALKDFVKLILEKVTPSRKRELRAEILTGSLNWKQYYDQYEIQMSGLVPRKNSNLSVNHCWRFIRRSATLDWLLSHLLGLFESCNRYIIVNT